MRAMLYRSIPLSRSTKHSWKDAGGVFARRDRTPDSTIAITPDDIPVINLGASHFITDTEHEGGIYNMGTTIRQLNTPARTRQILNEFMPEDEWVGPGFYWSKLPGFGGRGKRRLYLSTYAAFRAEVDEAKWNNGEVQVEVEGQEYRLITVGDKVVQSSERAGANGAREYRWVGLGGTPARVKELAREAARKLDNLNTVIGWDIVDTSTRAYLFEGNSCPGVNEATATRILDKIHDVSYDA